MPRIKRGLIDNFPYHVLNRGNGKQKVFRKKQDYESFVKLIREAKFRFQVNIFAYCLMPNHFHLVIMPIHAEGLSKFMQWLMTSHVRRYHRHYGGTGHIWQGRFKSFIIQNDAHLLSVMRYVEGNPVRAGLVKSAKYWMWSSCRQTLSGISGGLVDKTPMELPKNWDHYVDAPFTGNELAKLNNSVRRGSPYGQPRWQIQLSKELGLESTLRPKGRPRKK